MKKEMLLLHFLLFSLIAVNAQTINLEKARELALANSRSLARYELAIRSSVLDERNHLYSMLPQISAGYNASMNYLRDDEFIDPVETFRAGAALSVTQIIFQGGKSFIQKAISSIATESVRKDALMEYFNVLDAADKAYYAVLEAAAALEAEESSLEAAALGLSIAEVRQSSGMINQGDYLKALADMETRNNSRNQARRSLALNISKFKSLTGITGNVELEQIDFSAYDEVLSRLAAISDEEAEALFLIFWELIIDSNPSYTKAALSRQRAEKNHTLTLREYLPTISATIYSTDINIFPINDKVISGSGGITIRGTIPVDFWVLANKVERSKIARDSAMIDYANAESSLEQELQNALLSIFAQAGSVLSSRRSLEYSENHLEFVMERYRLSQSSVSELTDATTLFITSRNSQIKASYSFLQSLSHLRSLCALDDEGKLLDMLR